MCSRIEFPLSAYVQPIPLMQPLHFHGCIWVKELELPRATPGPLACEGAHQQQQVWPPPPSASPPPSPPPSPARHPLTSCLCLCRLWRSEPPPAAPPRPPPPPATRQNAPCSSSWTRCGRRRHKNSPPPPPPPSPPPLPARHPLTSSTRLRAVASRVVASVVGVRAVCCVWGGWGRACTLT